MKLRRLGQLSTRRLINNFGWRDLQEFVVSALDLLEVCDLVRNVRVGVSVGVLHDDLLQVVDTLRSEVVQDSRQHFGDLREMSRSDLTNEDISREIDFLTLLLSECPLMAKTLLCSDA